MDYQISRDAPIFNDYNEELLECLEAINEFEEMEVEM
jgi:CRISPR/Cas system CMR-associated protein Cmr5 small subunit